MNAPNLAPEIQVNDASSGIVAIEATGIQKRYGGVVALNGVDIHIAQGEIFGIIGPNGAGKSTLFDVLCGIVQPTAGSVRILGRPISGLQPFQVSRMGVSRSFQRTAVFGEATVLENLLFARNAQGKNSFIGRLLHSETWRNDTAEFQKKAEEVLCLTGLTQDRDRPANVLAYGVQRRLAVGVALMSDPSILFLDEPAAGMNGKESEEFVDLVRRVSPNRTVVIVEHDMMVIKALCHRALVMVNGKPIALGEPAEVLRRQDVVDAYLGAEDE